MKTRLPNNLNPTLLEDLVDVYCDDYEDRYNIEWGSWSFLIENKVPFTIYLAVGINGEEIGERREILDLLRIAQRLNRDTGYWPTLSTEWAEMCPGGLIKLDITSIATIPKAAPSLTEVLKIIDSRLKNVLNSLDAPFSEAERHFQSELKGLVSFNDAVRSIQRDFDDHPICVLNTNTKTRRLRFIEVLVRFAETGVDSQRLANSVLTWATQHVDALQSHTDSKGAILSSTGLRSVTPYLKLAKDLAVLTTVGRGITVTNTGRALILLAPPQDTFSLRLEERLYLLFDLLVQDRDVVWPLLVQLRGCKQRKRDVRRAFPEAYKDYLITIRAHCGTARARRQLDDALQRVARWQRPEVYMEHVVDPRLSWFVDLQLCRFEKDELSLTDKGERLAAMFAKWSEDEGGVIPFTKEFLRWQYFKKIAPRVIDEPSQNLEKPSREKLATLLNECCEFVWRNTKSLAPNRIVASTLLRYAGVTLFVRHRIAADFRDLINFLTDDKNASNVPWRLRWQPAQDDGYLTRLTGAKHSN